MPLARGKSRNPLISEVVEEARAIAASGVREIVLTGVNVGDFGKSTGETLEQLLRSLVRVRGLERLRLSSIEPDLVSDEIIDLIASEKKTDAPHIHMPLQSGSDRILGLMRRRYRRDVFRDRVMRIRDKMPGAGISTNVIVGFPGETDADFEETVPFPREPSRLLPPCVCILTTARHPGCRTCPGEVRKAEKERRSRKLIKLSESRRMLFMRNAIG